jgi:hypothetical protein
MSLLNPRGKPRPNSCPVFPQPLPLVHTAWINLSTETEWTTGGGWKGKGGFGPKWVATSRFCVLDVDWFREFSTIVESLVDKTTKGQVGDVHNGRLQFQWSVVDTVTISTLRFRGFGPAC